MNQETIDPTVATGVKCPQCGETFATHSGLRTHIMRKHGDPLQMAKWNKNIARGNRALARKNRHAEASFTCPTCDASFSTIQALGLHKYRAHTRKAARAVSGDDSAKEKKREAARAYYQAKKAAKLAAKATNGVATPPQEMPGGDGMNFCCNCGDNLQLQRMARQVAIKMLNQQH